MVLFGTSRGGSRWVCLVSRPPGTRSSPRPRWRTRPARWSKLFAGCQRMYAIVLAGGKGERLRPFTEDRPKPMVEIMGIPMLGYQLQWLQGQGVTDIVMACGDRHELIEKYFGNGERLGLRVRYAVEEEPLGRGGALRLALDQVSQGEDAVIATNGDVITNLKLAPVLEFHRARKMLATVVLTAFVSPYGIVENDGDGRVTRFREKPELPYWINAGVYVLSPAIRSHLP